MEPRARAAAAALAWIAGLLTLAAAASAVCPAGSCRVPDWDRQLLVLADGLRTPARDAFFGAFTWLGSIWLLLPLAFLAGWRCWREGRRSAALFPVAAVLGARLWASLGKWMIDRPRPDLFPAVGSLPGSASFPSAHALQITAFAVACVMLLGSRRRALASVGAAFAVATVAASRVYLQVHFPSDVIAGVVAGVFWTAGLRVALRLRQ